MVNILGKTLYAIFIVLLLGVAGVFLATLLPIPGNIEIKIVKSGSMEPAIMTGSIVVVSPSAEYHIGDVVTFGEDTKKQIPTTHRIVSEKNENGVAYVSTKGDANEDVDPVLIPRSEIIGRVVVSIPFVGYILDFARQPLGFTLMIGIPAGVIILDELIRIFMELAALRRKKNSSITTRDDEVVTSLAETRHFDIPRT